MEPVPMTWKLHACNTHIQLRACTTWLRETAQWLPMHSWWWVHAITLETPWLHPLHCWPCSHTSVFSCLASGSIASGHLNLLREGEVLWQNLGHSVVCMVQWSPPCDLSDPDVPWFCTLHIRIRINQTLLLVISMVMCSLQSVSKCPLSMSVNIFSE